MADEKCPGGGIGRRAGLKILYAVMRVRVQFPSGALENQIVTKVLAVSRETAFLFTTTVLQHLGCRTWMLVDNNNIVITGFSRVHRVFYTYKK